MKKLILLMCVSVMFSACSHKVERNVTNEWWNSAIKKPGTTDYDPPNGDWIFINNEPNSAQKSAWRNQGWNWDVAAETGRAPVY
tara:strand:+ start:335 stop:586 length:252 start_codon:yes stop_codon:yes gene_type:complete